MECHGDCVRIEFDLIGHSLITCLNLSLVVYGDSQRTFCCYGMELWGVWFFYFYNYRGRETEERIEKRIVSFILNIRNLYFNSRPFGLVQPGLDTQNSSFSPLNPGQKAIFGK